MKKSLLIFLLVAAPLLAWVAQQSQQSFAERLSDAAKLLTNDEVVYDPSYYSIPYPNGDVPSDRGVCTDVVIRAYRKLGIDLQQEVHEDMRANFGLYPKNWGLKGTDKNIDHRRVPNLMRFFSRHGQELPLSSDGKDYQPGDIVCWDLGRGILHIGLVIDELSPEGTHHQVVHNIGSGQVIEDVLFSFDIIGHYRFEK